LSSNEFEDYVCLAQAAVRDREEIALKLTEMWCLGQCFYARVPAWAEIDCERRYLDPLPAVETSYQAEVEVLEEIKKLAEDTGDHEPADERARAGRTCCGGGAAPELRGWRCSDHRAAHGLYSGLHKGHDPDRPRNLSRVVILEEETSNMPRFDVTIAGELNLDLILYGLPEELPAERELLARRMMLTLGSLSAIVAHNLAALGASGSRRRSNRSGANRTERLEASGVDTKKLQVPGEIQTGLTVILQREAAQHSHLSGNDLQPDRGRTWST
jgi:hypothetical protein